MADPATAAAPVAPPSYSSACPISILMAVLSGPWTLYILYTLSTNGPTRFGALKRQIEGISTKVLTERLRMLEAEGIIYRDYEPTIPPQVTYGLTERSHDLMVILLQFNDLAQQWYGQQSPPEAGDRTSATATTNLTAL